MPIDIDDIVNEPWGQCVCGSANCTPDHYRLTDILAELFLRVEALEAKLNADATP